MSMDRAPMNIVICRKKSMMIPSPATKQKLFRTGISVSIPKKKTMVRQKTVVNIDGPILLKAKPRRSGINVTDYGISRSARIIMNILSAPIARIRKGLTCAVINVRTSFP